MNPCCSICTTLLVLLFALNTSFAQQAEATTPTWTPVVGVSLNLPNAKCADKSKTTAVAQTVSTKGKTQKTACCDIAKCIKKGCKPSNCVKSTATKASNKTAKASFASQTTNTAKKANCQKKCTKTCQSKAKAALKN